MAASTVKLRTVCPSPKKKNTHTHKHMYLYIEWWRFILPIFLHVGIIHLIVNMLVQIIVSAQVEREMGTIPFLIVYMLGGIYGFVLGGNFTRTGIPSVGASGALFATVRSRILELRGEKKND